MPVRSAIERARYDRRQGKSPSTQAGEFVREEIHHLRDGKHGARSAKQAVAIGLSEARRAGVKLARPKAGTPGGKTRKAAGTPNGRTRKAAGTPSEKTRKAARTREATRP